MALMQMCYLTGQFQKVHLVIIRLLRCLVAGYSIPMVKLIVGNLVNWFFSNPDALIILETIIHPLVNQALEKYTLVKRSSQEVIVIEAIKLMETSLHEWCDTVWVTYVPEETQVSRLMKKRGMSLEDIERRLVAQSSQDEKSEIADVVIYNDSEYEETWKQVVTAWNNLFPGNEPEQLESAIEDYSETNDELKTARGKTE